MARGLLITIEGCDGAGKTTQAKILADRIGKMGCEVLLLHEPGGTPVGESIRETILAVREEPLSPVSELLLFEAARAQLVSQVIRPALDRGAIVVCDRFTDSTVAYQGYARGMGAALVKRLNDLATGGLAPSRTILIDVDPEAALALARENSKNGGDAMEREDVAFHRAVAEGFAAAAMENPERIKTISQAQDLSVTAQRVFEAVEDLLAEHVGDAL